MIDFSFQFFFIPLMTVVVVVEKRKDEKTIITLMFKNNILTEPNIVQKTREMVVLASTAIIQLVNVIAAVHCGKNK